MTRRRLLALAAASSVTAFGQGMSSRGVKAGPRVKASGLPFHAKFTDVAAQAGLHAPIVYGGVETKAYILETIGCGIAFIDYDNDGWLDICVLGGSRVDGPPPDTSIRLYKNNRDGTFADVTEKAGLKRVTWASSVTVADYNNDGLEDLFIACWGDNILFRNNGDGTFTDVTEKAGLKHPGTKWGSGCTFIDYDRDGHVDLLISHYLEFDFKSVPKPGSNEFCMFNGIPVNCGPKGLPPGHLTLYHNNGDGTFTNVSAKSGVDKVKGSYAMTCVAADFDSDGWQDVYIACDSSPSFFLQNNHDGTFSEVGLERGVAVNEDGAEQAGMGVGIGDYNLDGQLDLFKTHFSEDTNILYKNDGKGAFEDVTLKSGLGAETRFTNWGAGIVDLDNNGLPDLFYVTGSVYPEIEKKMASYPYKSPRVIFRNLGDGKFEEFIDEAGPGIAARHCSRGVAFGDFDNDGDVDMVIVNLNEPPSLLRNDLTGSANWLKVKLVGTKSNRSAIGATVIAKYGGKQQAQAITGQSSFYSVNDRRLHFGLGAERTADLDIRWPSGAKEKIAGVAAGQLITIKEGSGILKAEQWKKLSRA